jgi:acetolactate synthase-1/2/3 large subunit
VDVQHRRNAQEVSGAHLLLEGLCEIGVDYIFANWGTDHAPIIEELAHWKLLGRTPPQVIVCPHESTAAHMAGGYALATGCGQVALVHVDAGTSNAITALHNLFRSRLPVMLLAGKAPYTSHRELLGTRDNYVHFIQEPYDQGSLVRPYCKWEYTLPSPVVTKEIVRRGHTIMQSGAKGPVYLMLPRETLAATTSDAMAPEFPEHKHGAVAPSGADPTLIRELGLKLLTAEEPLLVTSYGGQTAGTSEAIDRLSQLVGMRVVEGDMVVNISHEMPCFCGNSVSGYLAQTDVGLIVDSDVPWIPSQACPDRGSFWAHIDVDVLKSASPIWSFPADLRIAGNSAVILRQLVAFIESEATPPFRERVAARLVVIGAEHDSLAARAREAAQDKGALGAVNPHYFMSELGKLLRPDDIIMQEAVRNQPALVQQISRSVPCTVVRSGGGGLGASGGMALGVKLAMPDRTVVQIVGDGGFYYNNPASLYAVANKYNLPLLTIILDNGGWAAVMQSTLRVYPDGHASASGYFISELTPDVNFAAMAQMFGFDGFTLSDPDEVTSVLEQALSCVRGGRSAILHVHLSSHAAVKEK